MQEFAKEQERQQRQQLSQGMASDVQGPAPPGCMPSNPKWTFPEETKWVIHEKLMSWTGDDFTIMDEDGNAVIEVSNAHWADGQSSRKDVLKDNFTFVDSDSQEELFTIRKKMWQHVPSYKVEMGGKTVALLRKFKTNIISQSITANSRTTVKSDLCKPAERMKAYQNEDENAPVLFTIEQAPKCIGYSSRKLTFFDGDTEDIVVAESAEQKCNFSLCGQDQYDVEIEPDVNCLMVFACLIIWDQLEEEGR